MNKGNFLPLLLLAFASVASEPPYEFKWANRTADEFEPIARLESAEGWRVEATNAEAELESATDRVLFGKGVMRLKFRANGKDPRVRIVPKEAIPCPDGFDTVSVWLYGNTKNGSDTLAAVFADAANREEALSFGKVRHLEWHDQIAVVTKRSPLYGRKGLSFVGFELSMATNTEFRTMDLTSLAVFVDPKRPIPFNPRPKRGVRLFERQDQGHNVGPGTLPFPNAPDTVLPPRCEVKGLEFRLPKDGSVDWSDLAFRVDGGKWIPLARGGGLFPATAARGAKVRFMREANSVVALVEAPKGVEEVRFGAMAKPARCVPVCWPYMTLVWCDENDIPGYQKRGICNPQTAFVETGDRKVVVGAMFDWTQSSAFAPSGRDDAKEGEVQLCPAVKYVPKTDGEMNAVFERFVWTVAERAGDVFTTVPNPPSPYMKEMSTGVWRSNPAVGDRTANREYWKRIKALGIDHLIVTDHETGWRDGEESFTFRTCTAPGRGGDRSQYEYARFMIDEMGFRYGLYTGLDDLATVNGNYSIDRVARRWDGTLVPAWRRCYIPKSTWSVQYAGGQAKEIQRKFGINTSYCDVHTCKTPWQCGDCDARAPGAATFAQTFYDFGEIFLAQKEAWKGPVYSEGAFHWWYSGLIDGNYAQDYTYNMDDRPWLVDFDLGRLHEKSVNFGVGSPKMLYRASKVKPDPVRERERYLMRFIAATLAFGHGGYLACVVDPVNVGFVADDLECEEVSYYLVQGIAAKYTLAAATEISYADDEGKFHPSEDAAFNGALFSSRVKVSYSDGTTVFVNGSKTSPLRVTHRGTSYNLPPNGWVALAGDGSAGSMNVLEGDRRIQRAWSGEYRYERINGKSNIRKP